ncbi:DUF1801 domain-containing protein [Actinomadura madurae]|uniref:DUF1801 domain-containing protein n=1 Tax=Actinomadura madurae TaxID=1993 RepID=UPI0020272C55|nr:DUF1801 domain-containing protein [Actinomadura madurae]MCP9950664.1 DUF1801 domain-containing protein [Actinomadura madurae]MCP9967443.1 DUF1801 domain-containing protein [Actinomadura madurae]MCP9979899.1 DUF1801 domain-containing protein [Actinomadura madurae]MCQ0008575.1 DUF1801 domain-containing protein [Actinomadura madurae]MCQ0016105.1 DUF1801 domain-containing protein [Actinomadura madurae]
MVDGTAVHEWLGGLDAQGRGRAEELSALVLSADPRLEQAIKWGRLTFTTADDWHHWLCGIAVTRKGVKLVFHKGAMLDDPQRVLTGSGRYVREVSAEAALRQAEDTVALVRSAIAHQTDMLE